MKENQWHQVPDRDKAKLFPTTSAVDINSIAQLVSQFDTKAMPALLVVECSKFSPCYFPDMELSFVKSVSFDLHFQLSEGKLMFWSYNSQRRKKKKKSSQRNARFCRCFL